MGDKGPRLQTPHGPEFALLRLLYEPAIPAVVISSYWVTAKGVGTCGCKRWRVSYE